MSDYKIGRVISVSGDNITIGLLETGKGSGQTHTGVPEDMIIKIPAKGGHASELIVGAPGSFIKIAIPGGMLLCMVTEAHTPDVIIKESSGAGSADDENGRITVTRELPKRRISVITFGTIGSGGEFIPGCSTLPTINNDVYAVLPEELESIYKNYAHGQFSIGTLSQAAGIPANINFDAFFSRHAAILGQSGGGKSWTVASVLQKIMEFPQSTTILFDLHGEYKAAFPDGDAHYIDATDLEFPFWLMNSEELLGLMVERSEIAAPNQAAKFKELVIDAKNTEAQKLGILNPTVDTPIWFDFQGIIETLRTLDTERVPGATPGKDKNGPYVGQFTRLLMRIDSKLADRRYDLIFKPQTYNNSASMEGLFRKILGEEQSGPKKIVVIDMSPIPFDVRNSVISLLLRGLFDFAYWHKRITKETYPIIVFCDEAHIYLNDRDASTDAPRLAAERIAKEGRKYGVCLVVVSQRPREVSSTILAQCNTFLCLRITNPDDQSYVKNLLPDSTRGITSMFSTLRRGECILLGDSVIMPTRIQIHEPKQKPESGDTSFMNKWSGAHRELNVNKVIDAWRRQGEE